MALKYAKLRGRIIEKYGTLSNFADQLGVSITIVSRKMHSKVGFSKADILKWCELLDISLEEIGSYFFA